jgi:hypothetical protein
MCRGAAVLHWQAVPHVPKPAAQQLQQKRVACARTTTHIKIGQRLQSLSLMLSQSTYDLNNQHTKLLDLPCSATPRLKQLPAL